MKLNELLEIVKMELKDMSTLANPDFRLEQVEYLKDDEIWDIVVSFLVENTNKKSSPLAALTFEFQYHRMYKQVKIDKENNIIGFYIFKQE